MAVFTRKHAVSLQAITYVAIFTEIESSCTRAFDWYWN